MSNGVWMRLLLSIAIYIMIFFFFFQFPLFISYSVFLSDGGLLREDYLVRPGKRGRCALYERSRDTRTAPWFIYFNFLFLFSFFIFFFFFIPISWFPLGRGICFHTFLDIPRFPAHNIFRASEKRTACSWRARAEQCLR